ncbi:2'-phosphotransferase [Burkholderia sp. BE12]|uniref:2'-phosphotransferase n=1 Tax=Burkholderia sp. BE12 TaxID=2082394 RepID=UPI000CF53C08|nr:2'-phosphotransferase [Burkholderia sp. BE12]
MQFSASKLATMGNPQGGMCKDGEGADACAGLADDRAVGARYGMPAIVEVDAQRMHGEGHTFFVAENGIWPTAAVPAEYLAPIEPHAG